MTLGFSFIEIVLASGLLTGGSIGIVTGLIIKKALPQFELPLISNVLLGIVGFFAGAYISGAVSRAASSSGAVMNICLLAAIAGSVAVTALVVIGVSALRGPRYQQGTGH